MTQPTPDWNAQLLHRTAQEVLLEAFAQKSVEGVSLALEKGADLFDQAILPLDSFAPGLMIRGYLAANLPNKEEGLPEVLKRWFASAYFHQGELWQDVVHLGWPLDAMLQSREFNGSQWEWVLSNVLTASPRGDSTQLLESVGKMLRAVPQETRDINVAASLYRLENLHHFPADTLLRVLDDLDKAGAPTVLDVDLLYSDQYLVSLARTLQDESGSLWDPAVMVWIVNKKLDMDYLRNVYDEDADDAECARLDRWCNLAQSHAISKQLEDGTPQSPAKNGRIRM